MTKEEALQLFDLEPGASASSIETRYRQIAAFLQAGDDLPASFNQLLGESRQSMEMAYTCLKEPIHEDAPAKQESVPQEKIAAAVAPAAQRNEFKESVDKLLFPYPLKEAGAPLSETWWKVYKRFVLLVLIVIGVVAYETPDDWDGKTATNPADSTYAPPYDRAPGRQNQTSVPWTTPAPPPQSTSGSSTWTTPVSPSQSTNSTAPDQSQTNVPWTTPMAPPDDPSGRQAQ